MGRIRVYGKWILAAIVLLVAAQLALPLAFRGRRMRAYLLDHLERSFGRPVEAQGFSMELLPFPRVYVEGVTIGENPAFGNEYFLRADRLTASVRWLGLLKGHFEFGTISLSRPSLILVRSEEGRWNLEGWLPPAQRGAASAAVYGPQNSAALITNHLQKIEFDDGRVNFKTGDEKRPFAFTGVSGSVEQMAPGRWQLRLEAVPWRSGVPLQSTGTLQVRGQVAGTSARLQPAEIQVHWGKASVADLFRMITGNDSGVRGEFALDGTASVGKPDDDRGAGPGRWKFSLHARAASIHRWDLTERRDNPSASVHVDGVWDVPAGHATANSVTIDLPKSHFAGAGALKTAGMSEWNLRIDDASIQAQDALAWYRAFRPDVAESLDAKQFFKARFAVHGRPLAWDELEISSNGGELQLAGFSTPVHIGPVRGSSNRNRFQLAAVRFSADAAEAATPGARSTKKSKAADSAPAAQDFLDLRLNEDFAAGRGSLSVTGRVSDASRVLTASAGLGKMLNTGWELTGGVSGTVARDWNNGFGNPHWSGSLQLADSQLQVAGLNLPLQIGAAHALWDGADVRSITIGRAEALGATWEGAITRNNAAADAADSRWKVWLHADHLDAAELDRWFGPRARPNWLQRLLPALLGKSDAGVRPSELLRRISADGTLKADSLVVEKIRLDNATAHWTMRELRLDVSDARADWAGGTVQGGMTAVFSVPPKYEIAADMQRVSLAQTPWSAHWGDRWNATATGRVRLTTSGVGRDELVEHLAGDGELHLRNVELHGWDIAASLDAGSVRTGVSRWASADGTFAVKERGIEFDSLRLENARDRATLSGAFRFSQDIDLRFTQASADRHAVRFAAPPHVFELRGPVETPVAAVPVLPTAEAKKSAEP